MISGIVLQFIFGFIIVRWQSGKWFFEFLGEQVNSFLANTDEGAKFVFGDKFLDHRIAFWVRFSVNKKY